MVPTNLKPRFFSALDRASEAGVDVGISLTMLGSAIYNGVQAWRRYQRHRTRMMKIQAYYESCLNPQLITPSESLIE